MNLWKWFQTGEHGRYMTGIECMGGDDFWITTVCVLSGIVIIGYLIIAYHWYKNLRDLKPGLAKSSLFNLVNIFVFCGLCGYAFIPIKMWEPVWKLHAIFLVVLSFFTWRYALNTPKLRVIYEEIHDAGKLTEELQKQKAKNAEIIETVSAVSVPNTMKAIEKAEEGIMKHEDPEARRMLSRVLIHLQEAQESLDKALKGVRAPD